MRILVLTSSYPTATETVASAFLQDWVGALAACGHDLTVVAPCDRVDAARIERGRDAWVSYFQYLPWPRLQTLAYGGGMYDNVRRNPLRVAQLPPFLIAQYREARRLAATSDLVHAHWLFPSGLIGAMVKHETGTPLVVSIHSTDFHLLRALPGGRRLAQAIVSRADRLHFVTEYHRQRFADWLGQGIPASYVAPMGVPDSMANDLPPVLRGEPRIGFMGRLVPIKGVDRLLEACARIGRRRVSVAGAGPNFQRLKQLAHELRLETHFVGSVTGEAKAQFLDSCDIMVFPSRHYPSGRSEGLPVSLLEALARGRVVVAADCGGIPEVIDHGTNGYLFAARERFSLRDMLREVIDGWPRSSRVAGNAVATARRFTASALVRHHETAYRPIVAPRQWQREPA